MLKKVMILFFVSDILNFLPLSRMLGILFVCVDNLFWIKEVPFCT